MKTQLGALCAVAAMLSTLSSPVAADGFNGPYIGLSGHYGWAQLDARVERISTGVITSATARHQGPSIAGFAGYDWKIGSHGVFGLTSDIAVAKFGDTTSYVAGLRARAGHLISDNTLLYATGGAAFLKSDLSGNLGGNPYSLTGWVPGWVVGGGIEQRRHWGAHPVRLGLEVLYLDFNARRFEVTDRRATLDYSAWSVGARIAFELNRGHVPPQPMK